MTDSVLSVDVEVTDVDNLEGRSSFRDRSNKVRRWGGKGQVEIGDGRLLAQLEDVAELLGAFAQRGDGPEYPRKDGSLFFANALANVSVFDLRRVLAFMDAP